MKLFKDIFDYFKLLLSRPFQYKNKATAFMKCVYIKVYGTQIFDKYCS